MIKACAVDRQSVNAILKAAGVAKASDADDAGKITILEELNKLINLPV